MGITRTEIHGKSRDILGNSGSRLQKSECDPQDKESELPGQDYVPSNMPALGDWFDLFNLGRGGGATVRLQFEVRKRRPAGITGGASL
jgi:hypothetical protein